MPNLNLKDNLRSSMKPQPLSPFKKQPMSGGGVKTLPVLVIIGAVILIAVGVYLLNHFGYITLWEKKGLGTDEEIVQPPPAETPTVTEISKPVEVKKETGTQTEGKIAVTGTGEYAIFIYSFRDKANAVKAAQRWTDAGYFSVITEKGDKSGGKWYRVSIGRYETKAEALKVAQKLADSFEAGYWVDRLK